MATSKVKELTQASIYDASKADIAAFAADHSGIEFTGDEDRDYMIREVVAAEGWVEKDPLENATHVIVKIGKEFGKAGEYAYRGGVNGRMFSIPREVDTEIPIAFYHSIVDSQNQGFTIQTADKFTEGSPQGDRVSTSGVQMSVIRFINKGK